VEEAVERYVIPRKVQDVSQFSWGSALAGPIEQFYAEWSGKPGPC